MILRIILSLGLSTLAFAVIWLLAHGSSRSSGHPETLLSAYSGLLRPSFAPYTDVRETPAPSTRTAKRPARRHPSFPLI